MKTLIVAGGFNGGTAISSTEILSPESSAWKTVGALPNKILGLRGANIYSNFYVLGGRGSGNQKDKRYDGESSLPVYISQVTFPLQKFSPTAWPVTPGARSEP